MRFLWLWFLAFFHLDDVAVCQMSLYWKNGRDYHDYQNDELGLPAHFVTLKCKRCGKEFTI